MQGHHSDLHAHTHTHTHIYIYIYIYIYTLFFGTQIHTLLYILPTNPHTLYTLQKALHWWSHVGLTAFLPVVSKVGSRFLLS